MELCSIVLTQDKGTERFYLDVSIRGNYAPELSVKIDYNTQSNSEQDALTAMQNKLHDVISNLGYYTIPNVGKQELGVVTFGAQL